MGLNEFKRKANSSSRLLKSRYEFLVDTRLDKKEITSLNWPEKDRCFEVGKESVGKVLGWLDW